MPSTNNPTPVNVPVPVADLTHALGRGLDYGETEDFLRSIFGVAPNGVIWTAGFRDFKSGERWQGGKGLAHLQRFWGGGYAPNVVVEANADLYFTISLLKPTATRRAVGEVLAQPIIIADDIGTKVDPAKLEALYNAGFPRPSFEIETSTGNRTIGWVLSGDLAEATSDGRRQGAALVRAWLVEGGLTDDVMDATRYIRLPAGWNSKPKYLVDPKTNAVLPPPKVKLVGWRLHQDGPVSLERMGQVLVSEVGGVGSGGAGFSWRTAATPRTGSARALMTAAQVTAGAGSGALQRVADMNNPEALIRLAQEIGLEPTQIRGGVVEALCPNMAAHTTRPETGFAFLGNGLCHCNHASCQHMTTVDFRDMMLAQLEEQISAARGRGQGPAAGEPQTAGEWWVRENVRDAGGFSETQAVVGAANAIAGAAAGRAATAAAVFSAGVDGLAERFAHVVPIGVFFDTVDRCLIADNQIDAHPAVVEVIPIGGSGRQRARNILLNHQGLKRLSGVARIRGDMGAVVDLPNEQGQVRAMANLWIPSRYQVMGVQRGLGEPRVWLDLVEHVIPDATARDHFLDRMAFMFQRPEVRLMTIFLLIGRQGVGKDAMMGPIRALMGEHNTENITMERLLSSFNDWMLRDWVIINELRADTEGVAYNRVKDVLTAPVQWVTINEKFRVPYNTPITFNMFAMSNYEDAIPNIDADDRRWQIYNSLAHRMPEAWYAARVPEALSDLGLRQLYAFLMERDVSGFGPFTELADGKAIKAAIASNGLSGAALYAFEAVSEGGRFAGRTLVTLAELETAALSDPNGRVKNSADAKTLARGLKAKGWETFGQVRAGADRTRLWVSPELMGGPLWPFLAGDARLVKQAHRAERADHEQRHAAALGV